MAMLEIKNLEVFYGVIQAIKGVSFEVNEGEVIALIGANGAGKTTILHTITGLIAPRADRSFLRGRRLQSCPDIRSCPGGLPMCRKAAGYFPS